MFLFNVSSIWFANVLLKIILCTPGSGFSGGSYGKESACNAGDQGLTPGSGRSPRERNGYTLQYSCLENSVDRGPGGLQFMGHK